MYGEHTKSRREWRGETGLRMMFRKVALIHTHPPYVETETRLLQSDVISNDIQVLWVLKIRSGIK
jgi:hypothetical protein